MGDSEVLNIASSQPTNLFGLSPVEFGDFVDQCHQKPYRAQQMMKWLYHRRVADVHEMTNLSKSFREQLTRETCMDLPSVLDVRRSSDGTTKWIMQTDSGGAIECVLIPDGRRNTLCISSQVGCSLDCAFCATGKQGFAGNLSTAEIVGQAVRVADWCSAHPGQGALTNIVFMGMGEPLLNFDAVMNASDIFMNDMGLGISKRRVTVSTAGVVPKIHEMCGRTEVSLAVSLHAPNDELRSKLVPLNKKYPLAQLMDACRSYLNSQGDRRVITFEYTLMEGVNDDRKLAKELLVLLRGLRCKVNLIPFNSFLGTNFKRPSNEAVLVFQKALMDQGLMTTCRLTRGDEIDAACGQLVGSFQDKTRRRESYANARRNEIDTAESAMPSQL